LFGGVAFILFLSKQPFVHGGSYTKQAVQNDAEQKKRQEDEPKGPPGKVANHTGC